MENTATQQNVSLRAADNIRMLSAAMVEAANSGHPGGPMGGADFTHVLYSEFLKFDPDNPEWDLRDRFFLDPGHMSAMLYSQLHLLGFYTMEDLKNFRTWGSPTPGHPEVDVKRGVENTSGPLGAGHAFGAGAAVAERFLAARFGEAVEHYTYLYISDGGVQEEISQGVGRIAGHLGLGKVVMFYDANDIQLSTEVDEVTTEDTAKKYEAWGWQVQTIVGNDHEQIRAAIRAAQADTDRPSLIIGKTIMGKGAVKEDGTSFEGEVSTHGKPLSGTKASFEATVKNLGGDPENPFQVFDDVKEYYEQVLATKRQEAQDRKTAFATWEKANRELAAKYQRFLKKDISHLDYAAIEQAPNKASRDSSATVLAYLADNLENMIVSSADLCNSDKTQAFLNKTTAFKKDDFSGAFLQAGVSELTMAAMATGMALHGGVIPACATFFAFSDYMKPILRLAALMEQQVIFIWTHDSFRVGEDGPTHQPIEQEAQLRLLEKLKNHSGKNGLLALRPADADETTIAWKMALENTDSPTGMIFSRQGIPSLPAFAAGSRYETAQLAEKGGYIAYATEGTPDVILLANGSEVSTLHGAAKLLEENKGLKVRLVSVPSEGVFRTQPAAYQQEILPAGVPKFSMTVGLPVTMEGLVGADGEVHGMTHFGYSANYNILDEKFGFTAQQAYEKVVSMLESK